MCLKAAWLSHSVEHLHFKKSKLAPKYLKTGPVSLYNTGLRSSRSTELEDFTVKQQLSLRGNNSMALANIFAVWH